MIRKVFKSLELLSKYFSEKIKLNILLIRTVWAKKKI